MPQVHRLGDLGSGHGCFPPRTNIGGSPNVYVNNIPVHRQGDGWNLHCIHGSEEIFILNQGFIPIEELVIQGLPLGSKTFTETRLGSGIIHFLESEITSLMIRGSSTEFIKIVTNDYSHSLITPEHRIYLQGSYVTAESLLTENDYPELLEVSLVRFSTPQLLYDISVVNSFNEHNFLVRSGLYLHNCCGPVCHGGSLASGSPNVYANGKQIGRSGDPVSCGSSASTHSPNVWCN